MKRYRSRFESLQRLREQQEKMATLAMMQAIANENKFASLLQKRQDQHQHAISDVESIMNTTLLSVNLSAARSCVVTTEQLAQQSLEKLKVAQQKREAVTEARTKAYQRLQSVNKAAEREIHEHRKEVEAQALVTRIDNIRIQTATKAASDVNDAAKQQKGQP